jgi:predicted ATPase
MLGRKIKRVAVTGAPCSGKSTLLATLKPEFPHLRFLPEMATLVMGQVGILPGTDNLGLRRFQKLLYPIADMFEDTSAQIALEDGLVGIVCDRGKVDAAAYLVGGAAEFEQLLRTNLAAEHAVYDAVLYLEPPPRDVFEREKSANPQRLESDYGAVLNLAQRTHEAWRGHPRFILIQNGNSWEEKVENARGALRRVIR